MADAARSDPPGRAGAGRHHCGVVRLSSPFSYIVRSLSPPPLPRTGLHMGKRLTRGRSGGYHRASPPEPDMPDRATSTADKPTNSVADTAATTGGVTPGHTAPPPAGERYGLGEEIAHGGMGVVYRATDAAFGRDVAVKVLAGGFAPGSGAGRRFADEARITGQLQHPGIPAAYDLGELPDGRPF